MEEGLNDNIVQKVQNQQRGEILKDFIKQRGGGSIKNNRRNPTLLERPQKNINLQPHITFAPLRSYCILSSFLVRAMQF